MELLSELIYILNRNQAYPAAEILPHGSKMKKLYNLIAKGKVFSDDAAARLIYKGSYKEKKYLMLKRNLVRVLSEAVFSIDTFDRECLDYQTIRFIGKKELMIAEKLLNRNVYHNAEKIVLKVKAYAEKFKILELQLDCIKYLRSIYALKGYPKDVGFYGVILKRLSRFCHYEQEAAGYTELLESKVKYSVGKYSEIAEEAKQYASTVKEWHHESESPTLKIHYYKLELLACYHTNSTTDWHLHLRNLTELLNGYPFLKNQSMTLYLNLEWAKYLRCMGQLKEALAYTEKALQQCDYPSFNKFEVQGFHFDLKIKEKHLTQAGKILHEVTKSQQYHLLESPDQAIWLLREAYLYFLFSAMGQRSEIEKYTPSFVKGLSVSNLTNACKAISKDKKGYNFMLVILKEAFMHRKYPDEAGSGSNTLNVYNQRYMKDSCEPRSKAFLKRFASLPNIYLPSNKATKEQGRFKLLPSYFDAAEIIPYNQLLELLSEKKRMAFGME